MMSMVSLLFIVNIFHTLFLFVDFEQTHVFWVNIEKTNAFEDKIGYIKRYVVV